MRILKKTRVALILSIAITVTSFAGCSLPFGEKKESHSVGNSALLKLKEMGEGVTSKDSTLPDDLVIETSDMDDAELNFSAVCDIDYSRIHGYYHAYSPTAADPSEITIICAASEDDVSAIVDSLNAHIESRKDYMQNYAPEQVAIVEQAAIYTQGYYVGMFIGQKSGLNKNNFISELEKHGIQ